ncbi:MAG: hypothetical protein Fur0014_18010 [Rubrivivax sp.]
MTVHPFRPTLALAAWAALTLASSVAQAVPTAPQVTVAYGFCTGCQLPTFETASAPVSVPGTAEAPHSNGYEWFTFGSDRIELSLHDAYAAGFCCVNPALYPGHNFNGWTMHFTGMTITGAQLVSWATSGLTPEVGWTADSITLNLWGGQLNLDSPVVLAYTATPAVPEPATTALLTAGLAAVGGVTRRRRRR